MRINVYTEELPAFSEGNIELVYTEYISSRTNQPMRNYGLRIYLKSHPDLHHTPTDDDRSAVTFWCGPSSALATQFAIALLRSAETLTAKKV